jgi:hypothetical protein
MATKAMASVMTSIGSPLSIAPIVAATGQGQRPERHRSTSTFHRMAAATATTRSTTPAPLTMSRSTYISRSPLAPIYCRRWKMKVRSPCRLCRTARASGALQRTTYYFESSWTVRRAIKTNWWPAISPWPIQNLSRRTGAPQASATGRDRNPDAHEIAHGTRHDATG